MKNQTWVYLMSIMLIVFGSFWVSGYAAPKIGQVANLYLQGDFTANYTLTTTKKEWCRVETSSPGVMPGNMVLGSSCMLDWPQVDNVSWTTDVTFTTLNGVASNCQYTATVQCPNNKDKEQLYGCTAGVISNTANVSTCPVYSRWYYLANQQQTEVIVYWHYDL